MPPRTSLFQQSFVEFGVESLHPDTKRLVVEGASAIREALADDRCVRSGKGAASGELVIKLKFRDDGGSTLGLEQSVDVKLPKMRGVNDALHVTLDGELLVADHAQQPQQVPLPRARVVPPAPPVEQGAEPTASTPEALSK